MISSSHYGFIFINYHNQNYDLGFFFLYGGNKLP